MKFSLWPAPNRSTTELIDQARWADTTGWHTLWFADHYMPDTGTTEVQDGPQQEAWAIVAAWAAVTERVRIGTLVSPTTVHHPAILANRSATVDHLCNGRFTLGLGAGWQVNEHRAYGIDLREPKDRVDRFDEAIQIVRSMLAQERTTFTGTHFTITDAPCDPAPVQHPLPILVGTRGPRMMRITAQYADQWNSWGLPEVAGENRAKVMRVCESVHRDTALWTSANALIDLGGEPQQGRRPVIAGSVDQVVDTLGGYRDLGFDEFILPDWNLGPTPTERVERLDAIRSGVFSQLAD
ncbi:MAG: LLM class flavin-dependent oxidoreductase [Nocardioides sp.]